MAEKSACRTSDPWLNCCLPGKALIDGSWMYPRLSGNHYSVHPEQGVFGKALNPSATSTGNGLVVINQIAQEWSRTAMGCGIPHSAKCGNILRVRNSSRGAESGAELGCAADFTPRVEGERAAGGEAKLGIATRKLCLHRA